MDNTEFEFIPVRLRARVLDTSTFCQWTPQPIRQGDIVTITRDARHIDGTVATAERGTWGRPGEAYQLLEDDNE